MTRFAMFPLSGVTGVLDHGNHVDSVKVVKSALLTLAIGQTVSELVNVYQTTETLNLTLSQPPTQIQSRIPA